MRRDDVMPSRGEAEAPRAKIDANAPKADVDGFEADSAIASDTQNAQGIFFLVVGIAVFSLQDILIKQLSSTYSVHQIVLLRSLVSIPFLLLVMRFSRGPKRLTTSRPLLHVLRGAMLFVAYTSFYLALAAMALADAVAIAFSAPLIITVLSVIFFAEKVGVKRWAAIGVGFLGVIIIARPGTGVFEPAALLAVLCALTYGASQVMARYLGREDSGGQMALYVSVIYTLISGGLYFVLGDGGWMTPGSHPSLAFLLRAWTMPTPIDLAAMLALGIISGIGMYCLSEAYRRGEASVVTPFEYTGLIWATLFGFLIFAEIPSWSTVLGMALIVLAGLGVIYRENRRDRPIVTRRGRLRLRSGL
ncbi:MAG: DMT family transporter [Pseudomonadota bacterium]